eukprot:366517-Chlamydomonas_euryale.AAC.12
MDRDKDGRLILSEVENAAIAVGLPMETTHRLFDALDNMGHACQAGWRCIHRLWAVLAAASLCPSHAASSVLTGWHPSVDRC